MNDFIKELQIEFIDEARDLLNSFQVCAMDMLTEPNINILNEMFRILHNIKGTAQTLEMQELSAMAHKTEDYVDELREKKPLQYTEDDMDFFLKAYDQLYAFVKNFSFEKIPNKSEPELAATKEVDEIEEILEDSSTEISKDKHHEVEDENSEENLVISIPNEVKVMKEVEVVAEKENLRQEFKPLTKRPSADNKNIQQNQFIKCPSYKIEDMLNYLGEIITLVNQLNPNEENKLPILKYINELHSSCMSMKAVEVKSIRGILQRAVREASEKTQKQVNFEIEGEHLEVDKFTLQSLNEPLLHILRNAIDHGIESSEKRSERNKPAIGSLKLKFFIKSDYLEIIIQDDGGGIDEEVIAQKAVQKGLVSSIQGLDRKEKLNLILKPGFSTKEVVSDLSGRGVGLDVVAQTINALRGNIVINSEKDKGSEFKISIPLSLSIYYGLITKINDHRFIFRTSEVTKLKKTKRSELIKFNQQVYHFVDEDKQYEVVDLHNFFHQNPIEINDESCTVVISEVSGKSIGFLVDHVESREKLVEKTTVFEKMNMQANISDRYISGVSVLPSGNISPIVNIEGIYKKVA